MSHLALSSIGAKIDQHHYVPGDVIDGAHGDYGNIVVKDFTHPFNALIQLSGAIPSHTILDYDRISDFNAK